MIDIIFGAIVVIALMFVLLIYFWKSESTKIIITKIGTTKNRYSMNVFHKGMICHSEILSSIELDQWLKINCGLKAKMSEENYDKIINK